MRNIPHKSIYVYIYIYIYMSKMHEQYFVECDVRLLLRNLLQAFRSKTLDRDDCCEQALKRR